MLSNSRIHITGDPVDQLSDFDLKSKLDIDRVKFLLKGLLYFDIPLCISLSTNCNLAFDVLRMSVSERVFHV